MQFADGSAVWISTSAGELLRVDAVIHLRCQNGLTEAVCSDGQCVCLAGPGCPPDFRAQLLREIERVQADDRLIVVVSSEVTAEGARWTHGRVSDLAASYEINVTAT